MSSLRPGMPSGSIPTTCNVPLSLPPTPQCEGEPGSDGILTYRSAGVKTIAKQGASFYAYLFDEDCISTSPPAVFVFSLFTNSERWGASLAQHQAATVLQCWKWHIWLCCWFNQQAQLKQKCLCLQTLHCGASTYARLVGVNLCPPLTPTNKTSNPKALHHPVRTHGQSLPLWKRVQWHNPPRCCLSWRHQPRAPDLDGGPLCMSLIFWAAQTKAAKSLIGVGEIDSTFTPYISPISTTSSIQHAYCLYHIRLTNCCMPCLHGSHLWMELWAKCRSLCDNQECRIS